MLQMTLLAEGSNTSAIISFAIYILVVFALAILSNRWINSRSFLSEYFLGSRTLGVWAFALTFAATSASGGSFMGFPSLVYTHGWVMALWIAGYMLVPIIAIGLLAKRMNQVARMTGAITIPDMLRERFENRLIGVVATYLIIFFMVFNLVAQFKAGSKILQTLLDGNPLFESWSNTVGRTAGFIGLSVDPGYLLCLLVFGIVVVAYTTYGGFRAVVWTDVLQGFFMVAGVLFMLPIAIWACGGLGNATRHLATTKAPIELTLRFSDAQTPIVQNDWFFRRIGTESESASKQLIRIKAVLKTDSNRTSPEVKGSRILANAILIEPEAFRAKEINDSLLKEHGIELHPENDSLNIETVNEVFDSPTRGKFVSLPGAKVNSNEAFLPLGLAISFFFFWTFSGAGQPSNMVRLMAFNNTKTLRRAIFTVCIYYSLIYFPIVIIFCCVRVLMPGWDSDADRIMPEAAGLLTRLIEMPWLAGILVAAPFAAVMSTMDSFLLMISSSIVRDIYQQRNPKASESSIKKVTYGTTILVGLIAMLAAIKPPMFLQVLIIFTGGGLSTTFLAPIFCSLYWQRANAPGMLSGMITGFAAHVVFYAIGTVTSGKFQAFNLFGFDPFIPGTLLSMMACVIGSYLTAAPDHRLVRQFFYRRIKRNTD